MDCTATYIPYRATGSFSALVTDYLDNHPALQSFYTYRPDEQGLAKAIAHRGKYPVNRQVLHDTLQQQYEGLNKTQAVEKNLAALRNDNTFTICTAHQPNLLTGYLYFIYKIVHAIKLAEELNSKYSDKYFVPVYYMGSEDNDIEELGTFKYGGKKYVWDGNGQKGAVGRMDTKTLNPILADLFKVLGPPTAHTQQLQEMLITAYQQHSTIASATQYLVNELFGKYGLIVLNPDEAAFKQQMIDVLEDDLLHHNANKIVTEDAAKLAEHYKSQAYPRDINLFYLHDQLRERIERQGDKWVVLHTDISWMKDELLSELKAHPERFSPNVILRGILQERILPDVAFIGGGAEVAYWLQLKRMFEQYNTFYPAILLRQSALWIEPQHGELQKKTGLSFEGIFKTEEELAKQYITQHTNSEWQTSEERKAVEKILASLKKKATTLDGTLEQSAAAALKKMDYQLQVLEQKMLRAEKRKHDTELQRQKKLKDALFPNGMLQERYENFIEYYPLYGQEFIDVLKEKTEPLRNEFLIISQ